MKGKRESRSRKKQPFSCVTQKLLRRDILNSLKRIKSLFGRVRKRDRMGATRARGKLSNASRSISEIAHLCCMPIIAVWEPLLLTDLVAINSLADRVHTSLPERPEVFEEKVRLFPDGCSKLLRDNRIEGYGITHPWILNNIPPLDEYLVQLPKMPSCLYVHDVVVSPESRGEGATAIYVEFIKSLARNSGINSLALVSVYETDKFWRKFGFQVVSDNSLSAKLKSYGDSAKYMTCQLS